MYPLLKWNIVLVKQYEKTYVYNLNRKEDGIIVSSNFKYEVINRAASDILELCDGTKTINDIVTSLSLRYEENIEDIYNIVEEFLKESIKKGYVELRKTAKLEPIKVYGNNRSYTPFHAEFEITKKCPLRCIHCYNNSGKT